MTNLIETNNTDLQKIQTGLQEFEKRKESLQELAKLAESVDIEDIHDKSGLKVVSEHRKALKSQRVEIQKQGKAMRDLINPISKFIKQKEDELVAIITPQEYRLQSREDWVKSEHDKIAEEQRRLEEERIQKRIDSLAQYGFQIDYSELKSMSDDVFAQYLEGARLQFEKEQAEKAEAERIKREQEEAERKAREEEQRKLEEERKEIERLRRENEEREAEIKKEKERIEAEKRQIEEQKQREKEIAEAEERARQKAIKEKEDAERLRKETEEAEKREQERQLALAPDKEKISRFIEELVQVKKPELNTDEGKSIMSQINELLIKIQTFGYNKIKSM